MPRGTAFTPLPTEGEAISTLARASAMFRPAGIHGGGQAAPGVPTSALGACRRRLPALLWRRPLGFRSSAHCRRHAAAAGRKEARGRPVWMRGLRKYPPPDGSSEPRRPAPDPAVNYCFAEAENSADGSTALPGAKKKRPERSGKKRKTPRWLASKWARSCGVDSPLLLRPAPSSIRRP